jgi:ADP-heptose:LPS heptosyltransferase
MTVSTSFLARSQLGSLALSSISVAIETIRRVRRTATSSPGSHRYLFLQYERPLGSALHATPTFEALKRLAPECFVTVACADPVYEILSYNPFIDRLVLTADPRSNFGKALRDIWRLVFVQDFDYVVTGAGNSSGRFSALAALTGIKRRVGFTPFASLYEKSATYDATRSVIDNNLEVIDLLGYGRQQSIEPRVFFSEQDLSVAQTLLKKCELPADQPLVAIISQTSGGQPSRWYDDRFARVADSLAGSGARIVFLGTRDQAEAIDGIRAKMQCPSASLAGSTSIRVLAAILSHCDLVITLDTGPMHVGRAVQVPMVVVAPAWQPAHEWLPLGCAQVEIVRRNDIHCRHCRKFFCATKECMDEITDSAVIDATQRLLDASAASISRRRARISRCLIAI